MADDYDDDESPGTALTTTAAPRLPMPPVAPSGMSAELWRILTDAIFPNAREPQKILLAFEWCRVRNLDIMKRPVNIVRMWSSELGRYTETIWPSINEIEVTASRTNAWAGMDEPKFGPDKTQKFKGRKKDRRKQYVDVEVELTFPEWCSVTVYRVVNGMRCAFSEPVYWLETYGRAGGTALPNDMWTKRPKGQLIKVAKAFSLRAAFPEEADYSADEMEGQMIEAPPPPAPAPTDNWRPPEQQAAQSVAATAGSSPAEPQSDGAKPAQQAADQAGKLDRAGAGEDAPLHGEPELEDLGGGIVTVQRHENEPWRDWCARLMVFIRNETEVAPIDQWVEANKNEIAALMKDAPKMRAQLDAAINKERTKIINRKKDEENNLPL